MNPSAEQLSQFQNIPAERPVALFYEYDADQPVHDPLGAFAAECGGRMIWAASEEQRVVGRQPMFGQAALLVFGRRDAAEKLLNQAAHARLLSATKRVQVAVLTVQPRPIAWLSNLLARVLPWVPFDNATDPGEEPGIGTSTVMPTAEAVAAIKSHPEQERPVTMINWFKFRDRAAYMRYGKVALQCTHSTGAKLIYACRFRHMLIGNGGRAEPGLWDEFALMQYPGRSSFTKMTSLKRYRRALPDREAGLADHGQGLTATHPLPQFVWRR